MPPPRPLRLKLSLTTVWSRARVPELKMPAPRPQALFPLTVLFLSMALPPLPMPPASHRPEDVFPLTALLSSVRIPPLLMPAAGPQQFPLTVLLSRVKVALLPIPPPEQKLQVWFPLTVTCVSVSVPSLRMALGRSASPWPPVIVTCEIVTAAPARIHRTVPGGAPEH